jgi:hypothetical protein
MHRGSRFASVRIPRSHPSTSSTVRVSRTLAPGKARAICTARRRPPRFAFAFTRM